MSHTLRMQNNAARMRKNRLHETQEAKSDRLIRSKKRVADSRREESPNKCVERLARMREYMNTRLSRENESEKQVSLDEKRKILSKESPEKRDHRLSLIHKRLDNETLNEREHRLAFIHKRLENETPDEQEHRLQIVRNRNRNRRSLFNKSDFEKAINIFCDVPCTVCQKILYPQQRCKLDATKYSSIIPSSLVNMGSVPACSRCINSLKKQKVPPQAFWNKMELPLVPEELNNLSDIEQRLLSRVVTYLKIMKVNNRFSQDWCRGQVVLFAQDVVELVEQLPLHLSQAGIVIVAESRENLQRIRQLKVDT